MSTRAELIARLRVIADWYRVNEPRHGAWKGATCDEAIHALAAADTEQRASYVQGFHDGANSIDKFGEQHEDADEAYTRYQQSRTAGEKK